MCHNRLIEIFSFKQFKSFKRFKPPPLSSPAARGEESAGGGF
jgi:hypothetical protein